MGLFCWGCLAGCADPQTHSSAPQKPLEFTQDIGRPAFEFRRQGFVMQISAGSLGFRGSGNTQRALFQNGPDLLVADAGGRQVLHLSAESAIALYPYEEIALHGFALQAADGTEFEGDELVWPHQSRADRVGMLGPTLLITDEVMLEGDTIVGLDLLLRGYRVLHVITVMDLAGIKADTADTAAGQ